MGNHKIFTLFTGNHEKCTGFIGVSSDGGAALFCGEGPVLFRGDEVALPGQLLLTLHTT